MAEQFPAAPTTTACTIVACNYLPAARVLADSYLRHHPDHEFVIGVIDADEADLDTEDGARYRVVDSSAFGIARDTYLRMATAYSVTELATSVKPYLLRQLRETSQVAMYLDPDIQVFAPMPELAELAVEHGIVLTPHFLAPLPKDGKEPNDAVIMGTGIFNLGFVAVGPGSEDFLDFWAGRLKHDAIVAPEQQLFTDQRWVDQVPALFRHHILRDPGFNVAYWNLHERRVRRESDGTLTAGDRPLRFFHFSGYRPEQGWLLTFHCARKPRILLSEHPDLRDLCDSYGAALKSAGYAETLAEIPYGFAEFGDGTALPPTARRLFRQGWIEAERRGTKPPPHAFGADGGTELREWLGSPGDHSQAAAGVNRLAIAAWESRVDLRIAFPHPCAEDADGFRHWCRGSGVAERALPSWAVPGEPASPPPPDDEFGVNLLGYLTAELGLGEMGRIVHKAIEQADVPVVSVLEERLLSNRTEAEHAGAVGRPRFPISIVAVNADQTRAVLSHHPETGHGRYRIGLWAWELEDFPVSLHDAFDMVDEVWTVSDFCRTAIAAHSPVPVKTIPVPVLDPGPSRAARRDGEPFTFLFAFDFNSVGQRKNPWGAVHAFRRAFPGRDDVRLVIKTINSGLQPQNAERLKAVIAGDDRIELIERYLTGSELADLYDRSCGYVSLHRSEGFGLTVAEAMARALPVIATDYASTTEFLDDSTGWPIPYRLVEVGKGCEPYHAEALWADPDLDVAAAAMQEIVDDPDEARRRGTAARERMLSTRSFAVAADWMRSELLQAYKTWQGRQEQPGPPPEHPLTPVEAARESLLWRAESGTPSRTPLAPAVRRAVLRAIDHYDVHQRKVLGALHDGTEDTARRLLSRIESLEARLDETHRVIGVHEQENRNLANDLARVRQDSARMNSSLRDLRDKREVRKLGETVARLSDDAEAAARRHHEMFELRDERMDRDEKTLQQLLRDNDAVHDAVRLLHAPVPDGADVVLCDAGALLVPDDDVFLPWIRYHRSWERSEAELMAEISRENPGTFLDVGAHVGYHTLRLLQAQSRTTRVIAVEADPDSAGLLRRNLSVNLPSRIAEQVTVLAVAAWDSDGEVRLERAETNNSGDNRVRNLAGGAGSGSVVPAVRLGALPEVAVDKVGLVKLDLQGRDHRALAGLADVLQRDQPHVVCEFCPAAIEELGDDPYRVLDGYRKLGYDIAVVDDDAPAKVVGEDSELVAAARADFRSFKTLWLRPR